jgi:UDP-N-acetylmuramate dehydrogenase
VEGAELVASGGEALATVCCAAAGAGLAGLEFASGIPGTIGGAVIMNAGAFEGEMADVVSWAEVSNAEGVLERRSIQDLGLQYRDSDLRGEVVCRVGFRLQPADPVVVRSRSYEVLSRRCTRQPVALPSAGCIFKRPPGDYAGRLVEAVGAKGLQVGRAAVSEKHANFVVNLGGAQAADVHALIQRVRDRVHERFGIWLETEIYLLGDY